MRNTVLAVVCAALAGMVQPCAGVTIEGELYNSYALVNSDGSTPLQGNSTSGDLVQIILTGSGDATNAPDNSSGLPTGNNTLFATTYVGVGGVTTNVGDVDLYPLAYDSSLVGDDFFVRFWNGTTVADSTYYGNSAILQLAAGDAFNQSSMDFVPTSDSPNTTDVPFTLAAVPEPSTWSMLAMGAVGLLGVLRLRRRP